MVKKMKYGSEPLNNLDVEAYHEMRLKVIHALPENPTAAESRIMLGVIGQIWRALFSFCLKTDKALAAFDEACAYHRSELVKELEDVRKQDADVRSRLQ